MNRRSFLRAATGCAVAAPVAIRTAVSMVPKKHAMTQWMDFGSSEYQAVTLWAVNLSTGKWRVVDYEEFMGVKA